jgi:hypothetical protein
MLLAVVRGGSTLAGVGMFLAGLYVGLGSLGIEDARLVSKGIFGGFGGSRGIEVESEDGIGLGPEGRSAKGISFVAVLYSEADGIRTIESGSCSPGRGKVELARSAANLSSTLFMAFPCIPSGFGRIGGFGFGDAALGVWEPLDCGLSTDGISEARLCGLEEGAGKKPFRRSITGVGGDGSTKFLVFSFTMMSLIFRNWSWPDASLLSRAWAWMVVALVVLVTIVG